MQPNQWTKSSRSGAYNCVELMWKTSSASLSNVNCVEVAVGDDEILVRNSKRPDDGTISYTPAEWQAFLDGAKNGEFDLPS